MQRERTDIPQTMQIFTAGQDQTAAEHEAAWTRRSRIACLIWIAVTCLTAAGIAAQRPSGWNIAEILYCVIFPAAIVLTVVLLRIRARSEKEMTAEPLLFGNDPEESARNLGTYRQARSIRRRNGRMMFVAVILGLLLTKELPIALWLGAGAAVMLGARGRTAAPYPEIPASALLAKMNRTILRWLLAAGAAFLIALLCGMLLSAYSLSAESRRSALNSTAHDIYNAAVQWQTDRQEAGEDPRLETCSGEFGGEPTAGTPAAYLARYLSDDWNEKGHYYAIICDSDGNIACTLYSRRPITADTPPTAEEQRTLLSNPFAAKNAVGAYPEPS